MIAKRYLTSEFKYDLLAILPLQFIELKNHRERLFYLIKVVRLKNGLGLVNHEAIVKVVKLVFSQYSLVKFKLDKSWGDSVYS